MEWTDTFQPTSEIAGNIEITFNSKNKEFDEYEPVKDQLVLTIGKTGRANRLTFEDLDSEELHQVANVMQELGKSLEKLEKEQADDSEFSIDEIEEGLPQNNVRKSLKNKIPEGNPIKETTVMTEMIKGESRFSEEDKQEIKDEILQLKKDGLLFEPEEDHLQRI